MNKTRYLLFTALILTTAFSCEKSDDGAGLKNEPVPNFQISFYAVDSLGNLVFPIGGPYLSEYIPDDFTSSSEFTENTGTYNSNSNYGHVFRIRESRTVISQNEELWLNDSTIEFYSCFDNLCDTILVFNPFNSGTTNSAEMIIWNNDTIFNYNGTVHPYELNQ